MGNSFCNYFFVFAHLAFCAAAILAHPSVLIILLLRILVLAAVVGFAARPRFTGAPTWPFKSSLACSSRAISASIVWIISACPWRELCPAQHRANRPL